MLIENMETREHVRGNSKMKIAALVVDPPTKEDTLMGTPVMNGVLAVSAKVGVFRIYVTKSEVDAMLYLFNEVSIDSKRDSTIVERVVEEITS